MRLRNPQMPTRQKTCLFHMMSLSKDFCLIAGQGAEAEWVAEPKELIADY